MIGIDGAHALAPAGGHGALQAQTGGRAGDHGPQDLGLAAAALPAAAGAPQHRRHAPGGLAGRRRRARRQPGRTRWRCAAAAPEVWVIGGAQIYAEAVPLAQRAVVTEIDRDFEGDAYAPPLDAQHGSEVARESHVAAKTACPSASSPLNAPPMTTLRNALPLA